MLIVYNVAGFLPTSIIQLYIEVGEHGVSSFPYTMS